MGRYHFEVGRKTYYFWTETHALKARAILLEKEKK